MLDTKFRQTFREHYRSKSLKGEFKKEKFEALSKKNNIYIFAESEIGGDGVYVLFDPKDGIVGEVCQIFSTSKNLKEKIRESGISRLEELEKRCQNKGRTFTIGRVNLGLLVCGEILAVSMSMTKHKMELRSGNKGELFNNANLIFVGSHTLMGRPQLLKKRLKYLSEKERFVIYSTNNFNDPLKSKRPPANSWYSSAIYVYYHKKELANIRELIKPLPSPSEIALWPKMEANSHAPIRGLILKILGRYFW